MGKRAQVAGGSCVTGHLQEGYTVEFCRSCSGLQQEPRDGHPKYFLICLGHPELDECASIWPLLQDPSLMATDPSSMVTDLSERGTASAPV